MKSLLLGTEALSLLEKEGFPVLMSLLAADAESAVDAAVQIGYPVTLKVSSQDVIHKTEIHGIRLSIKSDQEVVRTFNELTSAFVREHPGKKLDGIIVQQDGKGFEVIVGVSNDAQFGPILMFGPGGIFVEAIRDVSFRLIPIKPFDAKDMIVELKNYDALKNPRDGTTDLAAVEQLLCRISEYVSDHPEIQEMDLNPVFVLSRGVSICDARISLSNNPTAEP